MNNQTSMNPNIIQKWCHCCQNPYYSSKEWKNANNCHSANHYVFCYLFCELPNSIR